MLYWINSESAFGKQAVFLDDIDSVSEGYPDLSALQNLHAQGVNYLAPPMRALLDLNSYNEIVPSQ